MADPTALELLAQGRLSWNNFRTRNEHFSRTPLNLNQADLRGRDLRNFDLRTARLWKADLSGADLRYAFLDNIVATEADFRGANLTGARLQFALLDSAKCDDADFSRAKAQNSHFEHATLGRTDFSGADLHRASLRGVNGDSTSFRECDLAEAIIYGASLVRADFTGSHFRSTVIGHSDLSDATGLADIHHYSASTVDLQTLTNSRGIPELFLRNMGLPDVFIAHYQTIVGTSPVDFHSCFISYSSQDDAFCRRLHDDLQIAGIRTWFAPEDLKIGDRFRGRIDESINIYDKLLIVLSVDSINSPWVEQEIETAFQKERHRNETVLFPIRLDDAVMHTKQAWAQAIKLTRHMGDFTRWKDRDAYQKAFERLMRDLQASADAAAS